MAKYNLNNIYEWPVTTRYLIVGLLCAIVFYFGYQMDISSLKDTISDNTTKESDLKQQLEMVLNKEAEVDKDISQLPKLQETLVEWQKKLISYSNLPELLNEILKAGANNQLRFILFNPGDEKKVDMYLKVPIKVVVVGGYHELANFVSQIANMPWIVVVGDIKITNENKADMLGPKLADEANRANLLTTELTLDVYHLIANNGGGK